MLSILIMFLATAICTALILRKTMEESWERRVTNEDSIPSTRETHSTPGASLLMIWAGTRG
jgi:hypothetical protein